jgi:hypothetical protein
MKKALILHAWFDTPESHWYRWLEKELKIRGYEVWLPELPTMNTDSPNMELMLKLITEADFVDSKTVVIGHSLGAVLALRIAERVTFQKGILIAGWDFNELTPEHQSFWPNMIDHAKIKENVGEWVVTISDNDPYITAVLEEDMAKRLGAKIIKAGRRGHYCARDGVTEVSEILEFV